MSLEKEPAGAFNKAQRLIEYSSTYRDRAQFQQGPSQLNFTAIELDNIRLAASNRLYCPKARQFDIAATEW